jgi:hypothetical protein
MPAVACMPGVGHEIRPDLAAFPYTGQAACDAWIALHTPASMPVNRLVVQDFLFCATNNHSS